MEEQEEERTRDNNEQQIHSKAQVQQPGRCQEGSGEQNPRDGILPPQPAAVGVCAAQGEQMDRWTGCRQCSTAQGMDQGGGDHPAEPEAAGAAQQRRKGSRGPRNAHELLKGGCKEDAAR